MNTTANFLQRKEYFGKYRVVAAYNMDTNDFPRNDAGLIDPSFDDLYIKCSFGNQIYYYGRGKHRGEYTLVAYIPSLGRGHNIIKAIREINEDILLYIEETDKEVLFRFDVKYLDTVAELLKAQKSRIREDGTYKYISPYSTKNLPKTPYKIPDEELNIYSKLIANLKREDIYKVAYITTKFLKEKVCSRKFTPQDLKAEQKKMGLKGKNYIHAKGLWNDYCQYTENELQKENLL